MTVLLQSIGWLLVTLVVVDWVFIGALSNRLGRLSDDSGHAVSLASFRHQADHARKDAVLVALVSSVTGLSGLLLIGGESSPSWMQILFSIVVVTLSLILSIVWIREARQLIRKNEDKIVHEMSA